MIPRYFSKKQWLELKSNFLLVLQTLLFQKQNRCFDLPKCAWKMVPKALFMKIFPCISHNLFCQLVACSNILVSSLFEYTKLKDKQNGTNHKRRREREREIQITYWWIDDFYGRSLSAINRAVSTFSKRLNGNDSEMIRVVFIR